MKQWSFSDAVVKHVINPFEVKQLQKNSNSNIFSHELLV